MKLPWNPMKLRSRLKKIGSRIRKREARRQHKRFAEDIAGLNTEIFELKKEIKRCNKEHELEIAKLKEQCKKEIKKAEEDSNDLIEKKVSEMKKILAERELRVQQEENQILAERQSNHDLREAMLRQADSLNNILEQVMDQHGSIIKDNKELARQANETADKSQKILSTLGSAQDRSIFLLNDISMEEPDEKNVKPDTFE